MPKSRRQKDLAKIHIAKKELGLDEQAYRAAIAGVMDELGIEGRPSSANLPAEGRQKLLDAFREMGWNPMDNVPEPPHPAAGAPHRVKGAWKGRYQSTGREEWATQSQLDYIAKMEDELGWTGDGQRLVGFIERQLGKPILPRALRNRQASDVITGLERMTGRSHHPRSRTRTS